MAVVTPPPTTDADNRSLDERVAELEALIEEARQRARRRRRRGGALALALVAAGTAAFVGGDGIRVGSARSADGGAAPAAGLDREPGRWSIATGPPGFSAGIVLDPSTPGALYLEAGGRVFRSTDGGRSWRSGRPVASRIDALVVDPRPGSILYAGTGDGVLKSTDAGRTWRRSGLAPAAGKLPHTRAEGWVYSIAIDPASSRIVYASTRSALYRSRDAGATWRLLRQGAGIHAAGPGIVYATVGRTGSSLAAIARSTDGGATWERVLDGNWSLTVDPTREGTVWAVGERGLRVTRDGGATWRMAGRPPARYLGSVMVDPWRPDTVYVSAWKKGVFRTSDGGRSWQPYGAGLTELLAIDRRRATTVYAQDGFGVVKTTNGGRTWKRADAGITASTLNAVATAPSAPETLYAGTGYGLSRSDDGGRSWKGLRTDAVSAIAVDPRDRQHVLVGGTGGIVASGDGGVSWTRTRGGAADAARAIAFDPLDPRRVYALLWSYADTTGGPRMVRSTDGGTTWQPTASGFLPLTIAVGHGQPETVYAWGLAAGGGTGIARSVDGGASWETLLDVPGARQVDVLVVDPSDAKTLYALTKHGPTKYALAKTVDGGAHWTRLPADRRLRAADLVVDPRRGQTLYAATESAGVLRSTDGGTSWRPFGKGLRALSVEVLTFDATGTTLYAGTNGGGVVSIRVR